MAGRRGQSRFRRTWGSFAGFEALDDILRMTLAHGADLSGTNRYRGAASIEVVERGHVEMVRTPIDAGVNVDHVNRLGWAAVLEAITFGDGSERDVSVERLTPLQHARRREYFRLPLDHQAQIEQVPRGRMDRRGATFSSRRFPRKSRP
ncbi:ankyrin repeats family protein [Burkholderia cepacia]|jgi:hypothetical protein|nr:ankyrin repeats family protein [Burkholderia cepacia]KGC01865.1 ankyrin repeats family protein [Burkholderia cepacia]